MMCMFSALFAASCENASFSFAAFTWKWTNTHRRILCVLPPPQEHEQLSYSSTRTRAPSVIISGLKPATWYIFSVRTRTPAGYSSYSPKYEYKTTGDCKSFSLLLHALVSFQEMHVFVRSAKHAASIAQHQLPSINKYRQSINAVTLFGKEP